MYREYYPNKWPNKWRKGIGKTAIVITIAVVLVLIILASIFLFPKVAGYFERKAIEENNQAALEEVKDLQEDKEEFVHPKEGIKRVNEMTLEMAATPPIKQEPVIVEEKAYLTVPFICQAPHQTEANWVYHEESCEEAALLQVVYYLNGTQQVNRQLAHEEIIDMIDWQKKNMGSHHDLYGEEMKEFIMGYYGYNNREVTVISGATIDDIKKEIAKGNPVIVPIMGHLLRNPYYPYPGYHMLTVIGYTPTNIITNDVGTRRGKDFSYPYQRFYEAMAAAGAEIIVITPKN